jgi:alanine racemase
VKSVKRGTPVSYGLTERVRRDSVVAVLPIGYADGFDRVANSKRGHVLINGKRCKVLGRVCMNMTMVDVTDVGTVKPDQEVVLIGKQGKERITAEELATLGKTINYEIVTRINWDIPRRVI